MKSIDELNIFLKSHKVATQKKDELNELISLDGPVEIISDLKKFSKKYSYNATKNIKSIQNISSKLKHLKNVEINIDLSSIKSMDYESGFNYSFYVDNLRKPIAVGGRYDSYKIDDKYIRKATGFSMI